MDTEGGPRYALFSRLEVVVDMFDFLLCFSSNFFFWVLMLEVRGCAFWVVVGCFDVV